MTDYAKQIADALCRLGITPGDVLLVHSSLKSLGLPKATPADVIDGLQMAVGTQGTLVLPALSYRTCNASNPFFDIKTTPCCIGAIPEYFRQLPGVMRSLAPTHSCCAIGPLAKYVTQGHVLDDTPCGPNSPFARLLQVQGRVLFLGCGCNCNTSMHAVEELVRPPYLFGNKIAYQVTDEAGNTRTAFCYAHNFQPLGVQQQYHRVPGWMERGVYQGEICQAKAILLDAGPMWAAAHQALLADPYALVSRVE